MNARNVWHSTAQRGSAAAVAGWAPELRLALEMSLHEASERAAMEGELATLEEAWREAEEIAGISYNLLVPSQVMDALVRMKGGIKGRL